MLETIMQNRNKTKLHKTSLIPGTILILVGIVLFILKGVLGETIDAQGIIHENFFLLPMGFLCIGCGLIICVIARIRTRKK